MSLGPNIALALARRQKRLRDWQELFLAHSSSSEERKRIAEKLTKYGLLLSKLSSAGHIVSGNESLGGSARDQKDNPEAELLKLERELNSLFENHRLATDAKVGTRVATNPSYRPELHGKSGSNSDSH